MRSKSSWFKPWTATGWWFYTSAVLIGLALAGLIMLGTWNLG